VLKAVISYNWRGVIQRVQLLEIEYRIGFIFLLLLMLGVSAFEMFEVVPLGGDWVYPSSLAQTQKLLEYSTSSWSDSFVIFLGSYQVNLFPSAFFVWLMSVISFPKILLFLVAIVYFSMIALMKELGASATAALTSFFSFVFSALVFDYFVMGWLFVLVALSLMPLTVYAYIRALRGSLEFLIFAGVLFSVSAIQSQAVMWFLILFLAVTIASLFYGISLRRNCLVLFGVLFIFFLGNAYWLPSLILFPPSYVANSELVNSANSIGTSANFSLLNSIRNWGGLFNYQFESIQLKYGGELLSFIVPLVAVVGAAWHRSKEKWGFVLLMIIPLAILMVNLNRELLTLIPFGNVFRDLSRFMVLSMFATSVLAGLGAHVLAQKFSIIFCKSCKQYFLLFLALLIVLSQYPWWSGAIVDWEDSSGRDIRMRFKDYPESWRKLNEKIEEEQLETKALFYPLGGTVEFIDDPRFQGEYQEASDNHADLASMPGVVRINDRRFGVIDGLMSMLKEDPDEQQLNLLSKLGVRLFIFRKNLESPYPVPSKGLVSKMVNSGQWSVWYESEDITVYADQGFNPNIYAIYEESQGCNHRPVLEYRRVNLTAYRLRVHAADCPFTLVLNETYNNHWRLLMAPNIDKKNDQSIIEYFDEKGDWAASGEEISEYISKGYVSIPSSSNNKAIDFVSKINVNAIQNNNLPYESMSVLFSENEIRGAQHFVINDYVNGWFIDPKETCMDAEVCMQEGGVIDLFIEFYPQRVYIFGRWVTLFSYIVLVLIVVMRLKDKFYGNLSVTSRI